MKVVVAPNAFKGSLTAAEAAAAMADGVVRACPTADVIRVPVADGGDGLVDVALQALGGEERRVEVIGPRLRPVKATWCFVPSRQLAAIEMAQASGLVLLRPDERDPSRTTTFGTGELIRAALDAGATRIAVGIGGSATNDGGIGMASALGVRFLDGHGAPVEPVGRALTRIQRIDRSEIDPRIGDVVVEAVCDVSNPLCGPNGAAAIYAPQKGATPDQVPALDAGLAHLATVIERDLGVAVRDLAGAGAAGGLGAGLRAFLGAELRPGVAVVLDLVGFGAALADADLVLTGEGRIDAQTAYGKAASGVASAASELGIPCLAIAGAIDVDTATLEAMDFSAVFSLCSGPMAERQALRAASPLLTAAAENVVRCFVAGRAGPPPLHPR